MKRVSTEEVVDQRVNTMIIDAFTEDCVANLRLKVVVKIDFCFVTLGR